MRKSLFIDLIVLVIAAFIIYPVRDHLYEYDEKVVSAPKEMIVSLEKIAEEQKQQRIKSEAEKIEWQRQLEEKFQDRQKIYEEQQLLLAERKRIEKEQKRISDTPYTYFTVPITSELARTEQYIIEIKSPGRERIPVEAKSILKKDGNLKITVVGSFPQDTRIWVRPYRSALATMIDKQTMQIIQRSFPDH